MDKQAAEIIKQLADKLDVPVQNLWAGMIAYAPFIFWQWVAGLVIFLVVFAACIGLIVLTIKKGGDSVIGAFFLTVFVLAIGGSIGYATMPDALAAKYAPEAWASKQILDKVRSRQ